MKLIKVSPSILQVFEMRTNFSSNLSKIEKKYDKSYSFGMLPVPKYFTVQNLIGSDYMYFKIH